MLRKPFLYILMLLAAVAAQAQTPLEVQGTTPTLYLVHKVAPKETWYSLGRLYNSNPKEIAPFNNTDLSKGLSVGQQVKIPLNATNFSQDGTKSGDEVLVPVYHHVAQGEWMYRVSVNHNKVPIELLEKWNNISRNQVKAGMSLIVGYLKVRKDQSALAAGARQDVATGPKAPIDPPKETQPITAPVEARKPDAKPDPAPVLKKEELPATAPVSTGKAIDFKGGYFRSMFDDSGKTGQGAATIFRSTSGWNDGKYYALMDNVPVGTIILVSNTANRKSIYAKVLGNLSDIKENAGLVVRISNAAAAELGTGEGRFTAEIRY